MVATEKVGNRVYVTGDSYPIKDRLKSIGCHWDGERRQWWIGAKKQSELDSIVANGATAAKSEDSSAVRIVGKAEYKGRSYYVRWYGVAKSGEWKCHLTTLDGKIDFWAGDGSDGRDGARIVKEYHPREYRGRTQYTTLGSLRQFIASKKTISAGGECPRCKRRESLGLQRGYDGSGDYEDCPMCGCTYGEV